MIKTFNRPPMGVDTSTKDNRQQFFNQYQWKGLSDNKNFLAVDQETFSDCKNVYVDEEGLLKSRPSLKIKTVKYSIDGIEYVLSDIVDMWSFDYVTVYKSKIGDDYYLTFVKKNHPDAAQMPLSTPDIKLVLAQEKIFIFSKVSFDYYDIADNTWASAQDFIHIPVTKVISNGIELSAENVESPNILTSAYIIKYLYTSIDTANFDMFIGKQLTVEIDGNIYEIKEFVPNNQLVFVNKYCNLSINQFADEYLLGPDAKGTPLVDVSSKGNMIISSYERTSENNSSNVTYTIYHTLDGIIFDNLPAISNALGMPKISQCGKYCFVFKADGPYVYTLSKSSQVTQYQGWTNLLETINVEEYNALKLNLVNNTNINGYFVDDSQFAFTSHTTNAESSKMFLVYVKDNHIVVNEPNKRTLEPVSGRVMDAKFEYSSAISGDVLLKNTLADIYDDSYRQNVRYRVHLSKFDVGYEWGIYVDLEIGSDTPIYRTPWSSFFPNLDNTIDYEYCRVRIIPDSATTITIEITAFDLPIIVRYNGTAMLPQYRVFDNYMPNICMNNNHIALEFWFYDTNPVVDVNKRRTGVIFNTDTSKSSILYEDIFSENDTQYSACVNSVCSVQKNIVFAYINNTNVQVYTAIPREDYFTTRTAQLTYTYLDEDYPKAVILDKVTGRLITNCEFYNYDDYTADSTYTAIPLLFACVPICSIDNKMFVATTDAIFTSTTENEFSINEFHKGEVKYLLPSSVTMLSNYYFSEKNMLYISAPAVDLSIVRDEIIRKPLDFKWYFPEISKQVFDYDITNLHPISNTEVGIFFENSVSYVTFDSDAKAYRYIKSKLQTGCKHGSDIITSYDGKYIVFVSPRGFVAMTYQEFMATTEQALNYLSDTIYTTFNTFITEENSSNAIKLYKYAYWFFLYKQDSNKMLLFDIRNNTWWPIEILGNIIKCIDNNNAPLFLIKNKLFTLDKSVENYYDFDGEYDSRGNRVTYKIEWYIQSQKLHLNALNYYKHIANMTFVSSYNNTNSSPSYKLQINNYRKEMTGNINDQDSYTSINYDVNMVRTFIQRLNYFKVNEFQYKLSSDNDDATNWPLSLTNITIKYKISTQVR